MRRTAVCDKILLARLKLELANNGRAHSLWRSAAGSETSRSKVASEPAGRVAKARWMAHVAAAGFQPSRAPVAPSLRQSAPANTDLHAGRFGLC